MQFYCERSYLAYSRPSGIVANWPVTAYFPIHALLIKEPKGISVQLHMGCILPNFLNSEQLKAY